MILRRYLLIWKYMIKVYYQPLGLEILFLSPSNVVNIMKKKS